MKIARLVGNFHQDTGHWPDVLFCDPCCVHHIAFELSILSDIHPTLTPIRIMHDPNLPAGRAYACSLLHMAAMMAEIDGLALEPYEARFHPEACN